MYPRYLAPRLERALGRSPVVYLAGARQVGKTALARQLAGERGMACYTLDDPAALEAARTNPVGLAAGLARVGTPPILPFNAPTPREGSVVQNRDSGRDGPYASAVKYGNWSCSSYGAASVCVTVAGFPQTISSDTGSYSGCN